MKGAFILAGIFTAERLRPGRWARDGTGQTGLGKGLPSRWAKRLSMAIIPIASRTSSAAPKNSVAALADGRARSSVASRVLQLGEA